MFTPGAAAPVLEWQPSLFGLIEPDFDRTFAGIARIWLDEECWLDVFPHWLSGADHVFAELVARVSWRARRVPMFGRVVTEPRLSAWWSRTDGPVPLPVLEGIRVALDGRYGVRFDSIGFNLYRSGADSVAWHGDRLASWQPVPTVAIVSVGSPRPFSIRPRGGGMSHTFLLGRGDLLVMGGRCQERWEHAVPKVAVADPRLSITFRHDAAPPPEAVRSIAHDRHEGTTALAHESGTLPVGFGSAGTRPAS
ncbi:MAG: alpha-ketoglutarate-dependent dioxygenase AlkB [Acidimicrobiales bacterium]